LIAIIPEPPPTERVERSAKSATGQTVDIKISGVSTVGDVGGTVVVVAVVVVVVAPVVVVVDDVVVVPAIVVVVAGAVVVVVEVVVVVCGGVQVCGAATMFDVKLTGTEMSPIPVEGIQSVYFGQVTAKALQARFASSGVGLEETVVVDTAVVVSKPMQTTLNIDQVPLPSVALT
jgi:hypothetical protein